MKRKPLFYVQVTYPFRSTWTTVYEGSCFPAAYRRMLAVMLAKYADGLLVFSRVRLRYRGFTIHKETL